MPRTKDPDPVQAYVDVAVMAAIRAPLTYRLSKDMEGRPGQRVQVPLGSRRAMGVIVRPAGPLAPGIKVREILRTFDSEPVLTQELVDLGLWMADYYLAPIGEVFHAMLPLRPEKRRCRVIRLTEEGRSKLEEMESSLLTETRLGHETRLLRYAAENPSASFERIRRMFTSVPQVLERALAGKWLDVESVERGRGRRKVLSVRLAAGPVPSVPHRLNVPRRISTRRPASSYP